MRRGGQIGRRLVRWACVLCFFPLVVACASNDGVLHQTNGPPGASVHVLSLTYQALHRGAPQNDAIRYAYSHSGLAIVMTSLTTAAGLASFSFAGVAPIADLGIFASIGVLFSLWYTLTLLPALLAIIPLKEKDSAGAARTGRVDRLLELLADFSIAQEKKAILGQLDLYTCLLRLILHNLHLIVGR